MFALTRDGIMRISQIVTSSDIRYSKRVNAFTGEDSAMFLSKQHLKDVRNVLKEQTRLIGSQWKR